MRKYVSTVFCTLMSHTYLLQLALILTIMFYNSFVIASCSTSWQCLDKCAAVQTLLTLPGPFNQTSPNWVGGGCLLGALAWWKCQVPSENR